MNTDIEKLLQAYVNSREYMIYETSTNFQEDFTSLKQEVDDYIKRLHLSGSHENYISEHALFCANNYEF